jgi:release factor glutamine methyltransferase
LRAAGCVFAEDEAQLLLAGALTPEQLASWVEQRADGLPLEHVLGWASFAGLRIAVEPGVFVPRRRTEWLAEQAIRRVEAGRGGTVAVDLCCGAGAIGAAVAAVAPYVEWHAVDSDAAAVRCARRNLPRDAHVYQGDLFAPLPSRLRRRVALVAANAPYVPTAEIALMPPEARLHEPAAALDGGADGLEVQRRIIAEAPGWLAPDGSLLIETSRAQATRTAAACSDAGLLAQITTCDERDATVVIGCLPSTWHRAR